MNTIATVEGRDENELARVKLNDRKLRVVQ